MADEPLSNTPDMIRRAAIAVRNLIEQVPAGRGHWADWVPEYLLRITDGERTGEWESDAT